MAQNTYFTVHMYAQAARLAGTTDQETVKRALELGWAIEGAGRRGLPRAGDPPLRPLHPPGSVRRESRCLLSVREWPMIQAWWLQRLGVNLVRNPEYKQYVPDEDPFFSMFG